ncbi:MAG: response regulator transcription factor, partial [Anaerolineaceae bacterium]|nr:response regulator transcription factor [Anaerolineaceae bacterium]
MEGDSATILIVEDDLDIADMLNAYFRVQGYEVITVNWGEDGVRACQTTLPDLIILDIRLPDIDGFEVAERLRSNRRTREVPIIFLTERRERSDRLKGLGLEAQDYITKPFDIQELRLRVRNSLKRSRQGTLTNTVTGFPEGGLVEEKLTSLLNVPGWQLLVLSLRHLERFRETYGFVASDDLLRAIALITEGVLSESGTADDFLGHLTPTDFIIATRSESVVEWKERLYQRLEQSVDYFYRDQDRVNSQYQEQRLTIQIQLLDKPLSSFQD